MHKSTHISSSSPFETQTEAHCMLTVLHFASVTRNQLHPGITGPMSFFLMLWCVPGVGKLHLMGQIWPAAASSVNILSSSWITAMLICSRMSTVLVSYKGRAETVAETTKSEKPKIFTVLLFIENLCCHCMAVFNLFPVDKCSLLKIPYE